MWIESDYQVINSDDVSRITRTNDDNFDPHIVATMRDGKSFTLLRGDIHRAMEFDIA